MRRQVLLAAAAVAITMAAVVALAGHLLLQSGLRHSTPILDEATRTGAAAVGSAVSGQFARAIELGIPLDRLRGVEAYLQRIVAGSPQVSGLALVDASGAILASTGGDVTGESFPIAVGDESARLIVAADSPLFADAMRRVRLALGLAAILAGMIAGAITAGYLGLSWQPARARLLRAVRRVVDGDFSPTGGAASKGLILDAFLALRHCGERVDAARRKLAEAAATIRAIDFDGSLGQRVDAILEPLRLRYVLPSAGDAVDRDSETQSGNAGAFWRVAAVAGLYAASLIFVGNFSLDRGTVPVAVAWIPVVPLLVETVFLALGTLVGSTRSGGAAPSVAVGVLLLGGMLAATYWCRDYDLFVLLRGGAGFGTGLALAAMVGPATARPRSLLLILVFSSLIAGPLLGGLLGEALGRRAAFMALGVLVLAIAPFMAPFVPSSQTWVGKRPRNTGRGFDAVAALALAAASAVALVKAPVGIGYDNYLAGAGSFALLGLGALVAPRLPPVAVGMALAVAALLLLAPLPQPFMPVFAACAAIGLALGGAARMAAAASMISWPTLLAGGGAGIAVAGAVDHWELPLAGAVAVAALLAAARPLLGRPATRIRRA